MPRARNRRCGECVRDKLSPVADFRNKLFSFACLSSRSAATPFLIPKQPYFPHFSSSSQPPCALYPAITISFFFSIAHTASLRFPLRARVSPIYHPELIPPAVNVLTLFPASLPSIRRSFRQRSSFLVLAVDVRTRVAPFSLSRHFRPSRRSRLALFISFHDPPLLPYYFRR